MWIFAKYIFPCLPLTNELKLAYHHQSLIVSTGGSAFIMSPLFTDLISTDGPSWISFITTGISKKFALHKPAWYYRKIDTLFELFYTIKVIRNSLFLKTPNYIKFPPTINSQTWIGSALGYFNIITKFKTPCKLNVNYNTHIINII